jgi:hypothetical protein
MPFVLFAFQTEIVSSLLLSMLKQMFAEDRNDSVRATVIKSLALVMMIVESPSKYKEVFHCVCCLRFYFAGLEKTIFFWDHYDRKFFLPFFNFIFLLTFSKLFLFLPQPTSKA